MSADLNQPLPTPAGLDEVRVEDAEASAPDLDVLFARVAADTVDAPTSWRHQLLELPTPLRVVLAVVVGTLIPGMTLLLLDLRGDLDASGTMVVWGVVLSCAVLALAATVVALRGLHQRPLGWLGRGLVVVAFAVPLVLTLVPDLLPGADSRTLKMPWSTGCLWAGLVSALSSALALRLLDRQVTRARTLAAAGAGGLVGFGVLTLHCPMGDSWHLVTAHGLLGLIVAVLILGVGAIRR